MANWSSISELPERRAAFSISDPEWQPRPSARTGGRGRLHTCAHNGRLTVYDATSGEEIYKARVAGGGSFTASPIAADGHLYFTEENGGITVVRAGEAYDEAGTYEMGEIVMSTPAISDGLLVVRGLHHVFGIGEPAGD